MKPAVNLIILGGMDTKQPVNSAQRNVHGNVDLQAGDMTDIHTKKQRARNMAAIKGRGNKSTEIAFIKIFHLNRINGWRRYTKRLTGSPDFIFPKYKIAIFTDGCFWHGCPKCYIRPKTNIKFWAKKISDNINRDRLVNKLLRKQGWKVLRFWEHQIKKKSSESYIIKKIKKIFR